jgi:hypothetical protein
MMGRTKKESIFDEMVKKNITPGPQKYKPEKLKIMRNPANTAGTFSKAPAKRAEEFDGPSEVTPDPGTYHVKRDCLYIRKNNL